MTRSDDDRTVVGLRNLMWLLHDKSDTYFEQHVRDAIRLIERLRAAAAAADESGTARKARNSAAR